MGYTDLSSSRQGLLCAALLGLGQLCMYTGFDSQSFIVESVMHSVSTRDRSKMDEHSGYTGQAITYCMFTISNIFAPWIMKRIGSRYTLTIGSLMFTLYFCSFFYVHKIAFYVTSACMGFGFAMFYMGEGGYLTEHSTKRTIDRNSALSWAIGTVCMIVGGVLMLFILKPVDPTVAAAAAAAATNGTATSTTAAPEVGSHGVQQDFSDKQIRIMYGSFAGIALISNVVFFFLPSKIDPRSLAATGGQELSFLKQLKSTAGALVNVHMLMLAPFFSLLGSQGSFWMSVFPTTLTFSSHLSRHIQLPALYSISCGAGATIMGLSISCLSRRFDNFGQRPTMIIGCLTHISALVLIFLSTPAQANRQHGATDHELPLSPNVPVALVIAFLLGCADSCFNTVRTVICALVLPAQRTEAFSISKFYQSLTCCILLFVANKLTVPAFTGMLAVKCLLAATLYFVVVSRARTGDAEATRTARQSAAAARGTLPFLTRLGIRPAESTATAGTAHSATDVLGDQEKEALLKPEPENPEPVDWQDGLARTQSVRSQSSDKSIPSSSKTSMDSATMEETA